MSFCMFSLLTNGNVTTYFFCFFLSRIEGENDCGEEDEIVSFDEGWFVFWWVDEGRNEGGLDGGTEQLG